MDLIAKTRSNNDLLDQKQAAQILGVEPGTLQVWRATKRYPLRYIKIGRSVKYKFQDLQAFIEMRAVGGDMTDGK
jgi:hypothetical protein